jgi:D-alanyl-D-alanine carboxypeptidase/D-alanyl-D-alanine-endopeptidase (penicillin-binding protein 4)
MPGGNESGRQGVRGFLAALGIDTAAIVVSDGSGMSRYNLLSASALTRLLEKVHAMPDIFPLFYETLPVAGIDGTLENRMKGTAAAGNVRAKTGTLKGASALSGYVTSAEGELLAFSILMQNYASPADAYRGVQDSIAVFLSNFRRSDW